MKSKLFLIALTMVLSFSSCENEGVFNDEILEQLKDPAEGCETAFAYAKDGCFRDDGFKRWGWHVGPITAPYSETHDLYAGAGKCETSKGEIVGSVSIVYMDDYVVVEYQTNGEWMLYETHLYVGNEPYPLKPNGQQTVAPGQYGNSNSFDEGESYDDYKIDDVSGELYIIAHAVVCPKKDADEPN